MKLSWVVSFFVAVFAANSMGASSSVFQVPGNSKTPTNVSTPERYGTIGDGSSVAHSTRYPDLISAQVDYPGLKVFNITLDGAAFQKAVEALELACTSGFPKKRHPI
jgi:hypothetical protein